MIHVVDLVLCDQLCGCAAKNGLLQQPRRRPFTTESAQFAGGRIPIMTMLAKTVLFGLAPQ